MNLDNLNNIVNSKTGLINNITRVKSETFPNIYIYQSMIGVKSTFNHYQTIIGVGSSQEEDLALIKSISEAFERYCSVLIDKRRIINSSYLKLINTNVNCMDPKLFETFSDEQYNLSNFPYKKIKDYDDILWVDGVYVNENKSCLLPATFVYLYNEEGFNKSSYFEISSGLACHETLENAILNGILELIERDSFMLVWKRKLKVKKIDINTITNSKICDLLNQLKKNNIDIYILDISLDYDIPIILAIGINKIARPAISIGVSCSFSYDDAILKSISELIDSDLWYQKILSEDKDNDIEESQINSLEDNGIYYFSHKNISKFDFLINDSYNVDYLYLKNKFSNISNLITIDDKLNFIKEKLINNGFDIYYCDITSHDIKNLGSYVVRVIIPNMLKIEQHRYKYNGIKRLYEYRYLESSNSNIYINEDPHPFV